MDQQQHARCIAGEKFVKGMNIFLAVYLWIILICASIATEHTQARKPECASVISANVIGAVCMTLIAIGQFFNWHRRKEIILLIVVIVLFVLSFALYLPMVSEEIDVIIYHDHDHDHEEMSWNHTAEDHGANETIYDDHTAEDHDEDEDDDSHAYDHYNDNSLCYTNENQHHSFLIAFIFTVIFYIADIVLSTVVWEQMGKLVWKTLTENSRKVKGVEMKELGTTTKGTTTNGEEKV